MDSHIALNKNHVVATLGKPAADITKHDLIGYVIGENIEMVNFMYPAGDGRLKTLSFVINDLEYLDTILSQGERVDGSSLFDHIEPGNSDLYVIPRFSTAFRDPFAEIPTLTMLCAFFDKDGNRLANSPDNTLEKACRAFTDVTGLRFEAMGELEYYVIYPTDPLFPARDQKGYHESAPFVKTGDFRSRCMSYIAATGGRIKYGHSEVGNFELDGMTYEQNEIEFLPVDAASAADQLMLAKWVIRNLAHRSGLDVTFAPKITTGKAGSGLHVHMRFVDADGRNVMLGSDGRLSNDALTAIAGMMDMAPAITAFGNTNPTAYFRLVPHQEAPTSVCWGDRNRSVLVRVPLGWTSGCDMCGVVNPGSAATPGSGNGRQTVEIRSADGSANIYYLMAALAVACRHGWEIPDALDKARQTYVDVDIHRTENAGRLDQLDHLPASCVESGEALGRSRAVFEERGVFDPRLIDSVIKRLKGFDDISLHDRAK
ncbi:MAG: glutamine synthetase family protein, partial [Paramuribaculum sp.]|nr:glutamine synthetase family protein [Paramuribaculum sp.]